MLMSVCSVPRLQCEALGTYIHRQIILATYMLQ
jgi:hypothetical protein